jgi:hypothetical protein
MRLLLAVMLTLGGCASTRLVERPSHADAKVALLIANTCPYTADVTCAADQPKEIEIRDLNCKPLPPLPEAPTRASCTVYGWQLFTRDRSRPLWRGPWEFRLVEEVGRKVWRASY